MQGINDESKPEEGIIRAQYDSMMSQISTQISHEETRSADITSRPQSEPSETTELPPQLPETRESSPQLTGTAASRNSTEEVFERPKSKDGEPLEYWITTGSREDNVSTALWNKWKVVKAVE